MILLLGGTSEAGAIAAALAAAGVRVLVSTATDLPSSVGESPLIAVRTGMLDDEGLGELIAASGARAVVDATHPYAAAVTRNAQFAAARACLPYLRYLRPATPMRESGVVTAEDHEQAASMAFLPARPVLLTIGTRHLAPYLREARRTSVPVVARVLPTADSLRACEEAGLSAGQIVQGQGPFSVERNIQIIRSRRIGVLVTKDGGAAGGVPEKVEAARRERCVIVVVARPTETIADGRSFSDIGALVDACVARSFPSARKAGVVSAGQ